MTSASTTVRRLRDRLGHRRDRLADGWRRVRRHPRSIWWAFWALHGAVALALTPLMLAGGTSGDLPLYRRWATAALHGGAWPVLDTPWVYPAGALVPVVLPNVLGEQFYQAVWLVLLTTLNGVSLWLLTDRGRRTVDATAAWWWLLVLFLLSPVAFLRLEGFSAPLVVAGLLLLARNPRAAGVLLAIATWIKVWPAAVIGAVAVASRRRTTVLWAGVAVTAVVGLLVTVGGGATRLDSFVTMQADRRLQLEAPLATPWVWMAMLRVPGASVYQNVALATREVMGPGDFWATTGSTSLMFAVMAGLVVLLAVARSGRPSTWSWTQRLRGRGPATGGVDTAAARGAGGAGRDARAGRVRAGAAPAVDELDLVLRGALALTTAFVVFNKVGSPQYMLWIAPVIAVGLALRPEAHRTPAVLMAWAAGLTTIVFPLLYRQLIDLAPYAVGVLAARNLLVVLLFAWSVVRVVDAVFPAVGLDGWTVARLVGAGRASGGAVPVSVPVTGPVRVTASVPATSVPVRPDRSGGVAASARGAIEPGQDDQPPR